MKNILGSLPARLLLGVIAGILVGLYANEALMQVILTLKNLLGSLIIFCVPLIIIGFIAPSITRLGQLFQTVYRRNDIQMRNNAVARQHCKKGRTDRRNIGQRDSNPQHCRCVLPQTRDRRSYEPDNNQRYTEDNQ